MVVGGFFYRWEKLTKNFFSLSKRKERKEEEKERKEKGKSSTHPNRRKRRERVSEATPSPKKKTTPKPKKRIRVWTPRTKKKGRRYEKNIKMKKNFYFGSEPPKFVPFFPFLGLFLHDSSTDLYPFVCKKHRNEFSQKIIRYFSFLARKRRDQKPFCSLFGVRNTMTWQNLIGSFK